MMEGFISVLILFLLIVLVLVIRGHAPIVTRRSMQRRHLQMRPLAPFTTRGKP